jgi:hypothetical protein
MVASIGLSGPMVAGRRYAPASLPQRMSNKGLGRA